MGDSAILPLAWFPSDRQAVRVGDAMVETEEFAVLARRALGLDHEKKSQHACLADNAGIIP
jgi:hypothetical protein